MPRYFFNVRDGFTIIDDQGTEFPDQSAAQRAAVRFVGELLTHHPNNLWDGEDWSLDVTNASGLTLFSLYFAAVVAAAGQKVPRQAAPF